MGRARNGEAISASRRTPAARRKLLGFIDAAEKRGDARRSQRPVFGFHPVRHSRWQHYLRKLHTTRSYSWLPRERLAAISRRTTMKW